MYRYSALLLLPALLLIADPAPTQGQWPNPIVDSLAGSYVNVTNGGSCYVQPQGSGYLFVNENGSPAHFEFVGPRRLQNVGGEWDPSVVATPTRDAWGQVGIRFDSFRSAPGFWRRVY